jgi:hypothetical protein
MNGTLAIDEVENRLLFDSFLAKRIVRPIKTVLLIEASDFWIFDDQEQWRFNAPTISIGWL